MPAKLNTQLKLERVIQILLYVFLFVLPWQTIWIYREPFLNGVKWEYGTLGFHASEGLLWIIIFLFIVWYCQRIKFQISNFKFQITRDRIFVFSLLSLISYLFISITWSNDKSLAFQQSLRVMEAVLLFLIIFIGPFEKAKLAKWFIYGAILPAVLGIYQFVTQSTFASALLGLSSHPVWEAGTSIIQSDTIGRWLRAYGPFSHPNVFGGYLAIVILSYCYIVNPLLASPYKGEEKIGFPPLVGEGRVGLFLFPYLLSLIALFLTFSRSALLATAIVTLLYCYIVFKNRKNTSSITYHLSFIIYLLSLFIILSIIFFPILSSRLSASSTNEIQSVTERLSGYGEAWQIFKQHPVLGVGAGNYTYVLYQLNPNRGGWEYQPVHNALVLFIVEDGILGVFLLLFILTSFITYHISHITYQRICHMCYVLCVTCYVILAMFDHYLFSSYVGLMLTTVYFSLIIRNSAQEFPS